MTLVKSTRLADDEAKEYLEYLKGMTRDEIIDIKVSHECDIASIKDRLSNDDISKEEAGKAFVKRGYLQGRLRVINGRLSKLNKERALRNSANNFQNLLESKKKIEAKLRDTNIEFCEFRNIVANEIGLDRVLEIHQQAMNREVVADE